MRIKRISMNFRLNINFGYLEGYNFIIICFTWYFTWLFIKMNTEVSVWKFIHKSFNLKITVFLLVDQRKLKSSKLLWPCDCPATCCFNSNDLGVFQFLRRVQLAVLIVNNCHWENLSAKNLSMILLDFCPISCKLLLYVGTRRIHKFITDKNCSPWRDVEWAHHSNHDTTCQGRILDLHLGKMKICQKSWLLHLPKHRLVDMCHDFKHF